MRNRLPERCLAVLKNDRVMERKTGVYCELAEYGRALLVPRISLCASDQPEERHVQGLQSKGCALLRSSCMTTPSNMGFCRSQLVFPCVLTNLNLQMEETVLVDRGRGRKRLTQTAQ